jgi:hypothetical protein
VNRITGIVSSDGYDQIIAFKSVGARSSGGGKRCGFSRHVCGVYTRNSALHVEAMRSLPDGHLRAGRTSVRDKDFLHWVAIQRSAFTDSGHITRHLDRMPLQKIVSKWPTIRE